MREVEKLTREIAVEKARKRDISPELEQMEIKFAESLGTKVEIRPQEEGGKLIISYFSAEDLATILQSLHREGGAPARPRTEAEETLRESLAEELGLVDDVPKKDKTDDSFSVENFSI